MIQVKLYLYDSTQEANGYRGEDLSAYVLSGAQNTENLTEELDVSELTLQGYYEQKEFAPESKFIIDIYEDNTLMATYHRIVQEDVVEQPILSDNEYFTHTITLIEPSAIAQKRIVDNISVTYKLKDVDLETKTTFKVDQVAETDIKNGTSGIQNAPSRGFANYVDKTGFSDTRNNSFGKYFLWKKPDNSSDIKLQYTDINNNLVTSSLYYTDIGKIKQDQDNIKRAAFEIPVPYIMWGIEDTDAYNEQNPQRPPVLKGYKPIGVASFTCTITERDAAFRVTEGYPKVYTFVSNSNLATAINGDTGNTIDTTFPYLRTSNTIVQYYKNGYTKAKFESEYLVERIITLGEKPSFWANWSDTTTYYFTKYTDSVNGSNYGGDTYVTTERIEIKEGHTYEVALEIKNLSDGSIPVEFRQDVEGTPNFDRQLVDCYNDTTFVSFCYTKNKRAYNVLVDNYAQNKETYFLSTKNSKISNAYRFYGSDGINAVLTSGIPYTAMSLIKKAIINSDVYFKEDNLSCVDLEEGGYPFYVSSAKDENITIPMVLASDLEKIQINEAFYRQKNLWEVLLEVGKYAHAIPQITFGKNDKLAISFYKLGSETLRNDQTATDRLPNAARISIMNFRKIDDYLSACSSYVDNLVQLGGSIVEMVAPKTSSEDYLVSNDTAQIKVSKPIIELLHIWAIPAKDFYAKGYYFQKGLKREITDYVYEESIYNILSVRYDQTPNKGIALYYSLGDNVIRGGDYQLPQAVTNAYSDYSFKKILFSAFYTYDTSLSLLTGTGPWYDIKVNDFVFEVEYRTKDTARVEHCRPDIKKYLLTSEHDKTPTHKQFNNQQDILVDSVAFGGSMFGKLIRTGNTNYKTNEWYNYFGNIKHKGELYFVNDGWYYVAKVTNIFFPNHIESIVEYSKDYNQLSEIVGIPSEPRFYEISERSSIDREVAINDYLIVTQDSRDIDENASLISDLEHTKDLIFGNGGTYLKWANTRFKGDPDLAPQDEGTFGIKDTETTVLSPINAYSCGNTLTYEWDMEDNLSAGDRVIAINTDDYYVGEITQSYFPTSSELNDFVITTESRQPRLGDCVYANKTLNGVVYEVRRYVYDGSNWVVQDPDSAYKTMRAVQYCDVYGKSTLFDFALYADMPLSTEQIQLLPESPYDIDETTNIVSNLNVGKSVVLLKDCREVLHFNYNLMQITDDDDFILSPFFFSNDKLNGAKIVLLSEKVNKMANGYIGVNAILYENNSPSISVSNNKIVVDMSWARNLPFDIQNATKSIVIMEKSQIGDMQKFTIAMNKNYNDFADWYFGAPNKDAIWSRENGNKQ